MTKFKNPSMKGASKNLSKILNPKPKKKTLKEETKKIGKEIINDLEERGIFV